jgi:hypothetical protein
MAPIIATPPAEKLSERITVSLTPADMARVQRIAAKTGVKPGALGRQGLLELISRLERQQRQATSSTDGN